MADKSCKPDALQPAIAELLNKYAEKAFDISERAATKAARNARTTLKATRHDKGGKYARGWAVRLENKGSIFFEATVYNRATPGLPHLLEHSHPTGRYRGGHYEGDGEISQAEQTANELFLSEVKKAL